MRRIIGYCIFAVFGAGFLAAAYAADGWAALAGIALGLGTIGGLTLAFVLVNG